MKIDVSILCFLSVTHPGPSREGIKSVKFPSTGGMVPMRFAIGTGVGNSAFPHSGIGGSLGFGKPFTSLSILTGLFVRMLMLAAVPIRMLMAPLA